jgi:PAS domain S-box-containing protein
MDNNSILAKTAKGIAYTKNESGEINYDAVRVLRSVNGKSTIAELRAQFRDLTDTRFQKAVAALESKELVNVLLAREPGAVNDPVSRKLDKQLHDLAQTVVQTLDFTRLKRSLLEAVQKSPPAASAPETEKPREHAPASSPPVTTVQPQPAQHLSDVNAAVKAKLEAELRPLIEEELRGKLIIALRPQIEEELRHKLIAALRPVLETEIRAKLTAALEPRVAEELRSQWKSQAAQHEQSSVMAEPGVTATHEAETNQRLLECIRETVFRTDLSGNSVYVNARWTKLTGFGADETLSKPLAQFFVVEDQHGVADYLDAVARGATVPVVFEARLTRKSAIPLRVALRAAPLTSVTNATIGVCGTLRGTA